MRRERQSRNHGCDFGRKNFDMNNTFSNNLCNSMEEKRKYFMM